MESKNIYLGIGISLLLILIFYIPFKLTGIRFIIGFILMIVPFWLFLSLFDFDVVEKLIFSVFISPITFPLLVWYFNWLIPSLRLTILIVYLALLFLAISFSRPQKQNL